MWWEGLGVMGMGSVAEHGCRNFRRFFEVLRVLENSYGYGCSELLCDFRDRQNPVAAKRLKSRQAGYSPLI